MTVAEITYRSDFSVELVDAMGGDDTILRAMMVSTLKDNQVNKMPAGEREGKIGFLMRNRHGSPFEHNAMTWRVEAPIMVFREWHRHRIGVSYNEQSARYVEMPPIFYIPPRERPLVQQGKPGHYEMVEAPESVYLRMLSYHRESYAFSYGCYQRMIAEGIAKEVARNVLGVGLYSAMYFTCNARSMMAFLSLRTRDGEATFPSKPQWEIDQCARLMELNGEDTFKMRFPITHSQFEACGRVCP